MPFGLKNAGATYQHLVNVMFRDLINKNMEVYVDDMLIKSKEAGGHVQDLEECFTILRKNSDRENMICKCTQSIQVI